MRKKSGEGLSTPSSAEVVINLASRPNDSSVALAVGGWLPAIADEPAVLRQFGQARPGVGIEIARFDPEIGAGSLALGDGGRTSKPGRSRSNIPR